MAGNLAARFLRAFVMRQVTLAFLLLYVSAAIAQNGKPAAATDTKHAPSAKATVSALLLSDIHFEPFWDPDKVPQLAAAPASEWKAILAAPPSHDQAQRFAALQQSCHVRGADTSFPLFDSSLKAMRSHSASLRFAAVSGDLLSHEFSCKYKALFSQSTAEDYRAFAEKTINYVIDAFYGAFPGLPVYIALGNNDSDCGDYQIDANSEFLSRVGSEVTKNFPAAEQAGTRASFSEGGYYGVSLPAPLRNARLLVLNDIFMSKNYSTCTGKPDLRESEAQLVWLHQQLAEARVNKQRVWVMGHIPPGVDLYSSAKKMATLCIGGDPSMFLSSEKLADLLAEYGDVVQLAIFAHTHMDELRILKTGKNRYAAKAGVKELKTVPDFDNYMADNPASDVAVKMLPSISPINGNKPSFTIARINPATAALADYQVIAASNSSGVDVAWTEEYDFARSYHEAEFTSATVAQIVDRFAADPNASTQASQEYIRNFSAGNPSPLLRLFWPQYVCVLSHDSAQEFKACVCPAAQ
ncbi:MAG: metallophosphoesterase [Terracidiphilus sp.]